MNTEDIWNSFLKNIKSKVSLMSYNYIFKDLKLYSLKNSKAIIVVPTNELLKQNIEKNYHNIIEETLNDITNDSIEIEYIYDSNINDLKKEEEKIEIKEEKPKLEDDISNYRYSSNFNPKYTFDTFVVGESNKLAYGTAKAVAENPGKLYNPFYIFANSGLGKTHLMFAIGNYIVNHSDKKVLYITAEDFSNDYISIVNNKNKETNVSYLEAFRNKYRDVDVLMIDDIQFLERKEKTQVEFTNTFNDLYYSEKQIIIASDKPIEDYKYLDDRLKTRFKWGLTELINPPELELKKNIIKNKILVNNFDLDIDDTIIDYIASNCGSDIRNVENSVIRLVAYKSMFNKKEINLETAKEALNEYIDKPIYKTNSVEKIMDVVAKFYGIDVSMIKGKMKKKPIADARAIAMYLSRMITDSSLEKIGLIIGGRDHSTVIHSYEKISNELKTNARLQEEINILINKLNE